MDWHNKLQEKSLSTAIFKFLFFSMPNLCMGLKKKMTGICIILIFGVGQAELFQPRNKTENHYGFVWRTNHFKSLWFLFGEWVISSQFYFV